MFSSKNSEEKKRLKAEKEKQEQEQRLLEQRVDDVLNKVIVFPGSKAEFEDFIGYKTEWLDIGYSMKGILYRDYGVNPFDRNPFDDYEFSFQKKLADSELVAIVSTGYTFNDGQSVPTTRLYFGMPVIKSMNSKNDSNINSNSEESK